jgi:K+-sensing histidine kinase KdpD
MVSAGQLRAAFRLNSSLGLDQILDAACKAAVDLFAVDHSAISIVETGVQSRSIEAQYPKLMREAKEFQLGVHLQDVPVLQQIAENRYPLIIEEVANNKVLLGSLHQEFLKFDILTTLLAPIEVKGQVVGCFSLNSIGRRRKFTKEETDLCDIFAAHVGTAVENAQLFEDLRRIKGYVGSRTAFEWMKMVSDRWSHDITGAVSAASADVKNIETSLNKHDVGEARTRLKALNGMIESIANIPITPPLSAEHRIDLIPINHLLKRYLDGVWRHSRYLSVKLRYDLQEDLDTVGVVRASGAWLRQLFEILVNNAVEAMLVADSPMKELMVGTRVVGTRAQGERIEVSVRDTGPGIPRDFLGHIFEMPKDKPEGSKGAGVGLMLAATIARTYGGDIRLGSTGVEGTTMVVTLPMEKLS